ncbi:ubiquitin-like-specific protease [Arachis hypogaea]|uniref:Ubiquitin-like-specific protease n=1 Tax=Arachis hypogaea TaxID=3818 RepID=A0A6B9VBN0_ARAHY|nr:ubiquitin-like-specific protease [Arachis hypogaea]
MMRSDCDDGRPMDSWSKVRLWRPMKEGSIYHWSGRTSAHCCPGVGSPATSFSGCVQPLMTQNRCGLRMTFTETVLQKRNLDSFREVPTVSYVGLDPHFGGDTRFFDKIAASMRKWWFAPVCIDHHWWLYAFEIAQKRLWVLDSMYTGEPNNERLKIHAYAGRIIEDMAKVSMPTYQHTENGYLVSILASQNNITGHCDCGVFVIKFMQFWSLDKPLQHWDKEFRKEIILDIVMGPHNSEIGKAL